MKRSKPKDGYLDFKSKAAYMRWVKFGHVTGAFKAPGNQRIRIRGKVHKVKHKKK